MSTILSLMFTYQGDDQHMLVSTKQSADKIYHKITIMDGGLENLMGNANLVFEENGRLLVDDCDGNVERLQLKKSIVEAIGDYMNKEVIYLFEQDNR